MVKNALADTKSNHIAKNEMGMGRVSSITHTKFQGSAREKMIKGTQLNFKQDVLWS